MTTPNQELGNEQLDAFLLELGVLSPPLPTETVEQDPSLDHLLDEIFELTKTPSPPPATPSLPTLPLEEEKKKRSYSLIWITATLLFGLLAGSAFGFNWAKSEGLMEKPIIEPQEEITHQISYWIKELSTIYETLEPPAEEVIEPIEPPTEMEVLAPTEMT